MPAPRPRKEKAPVISETAEQKTVVAHIRKFGFEDDRVIWTHIRGERAGAWQRLQAWKMGVNTKFPDLHFILMSNRGWIEMKKRGFVEKFARGVGIDDHVAAQLALHERLRAHGDWVEICETLEGVQSTLRKHDMPLCAKSITATRLARGIRNALAEVE